MSLEEQIKLEERGASAGISRAIAQAKEAADAENTNVAARRLIKEFLEPLTEAVSVFCATQEKRACIANAARTMLRDMDPQVVAYITLNTVFRGFETVCWPLSQAARTLGSALDDEKLCQTFADKNPDDYKNALLIKYTSGSVVRKQKIVRIFAKRHGHQHSWTHEQQVRIGSFLIDLLVKVTNIAQVQRVHGQYVVMPTPETSEWMRKCIVNIGMRHPVYYPCVHPPVPWTTYQEGGYHTPRMRYATPMVRVRTPLQAKLLDTDMATVFKAVNALQETAWRVNEPVLEVLQACWKAGVPIGIPRSTPYDFPESPVKEKDNLCAEDKALLDAWKHETLILHSMERERVAKSFSVSAALRTANEFKGRDLWFVYTCDFRGRMYCTASGMSPQGTDVGKALLRFSEGKVLGKRGAWWLMVHGANCYGQDKITLADRVLWVENNTAAAAFASCRVFMLRAISSPLSFIRTRQRVRGV